MAQLSQAPLEKALFALDPLFNVPVKLFISKLLSLESMPSSPNILNLFGHPIAHVEIFGTIISHDAFVDKELLTIEDSTGALPCILWTDPNLWSSTRFLADQHPLQKGEIVLGDLVRVRGKIRVNSDMNRGTSVELSIHSIQKERDPNMEVLHWLEVMTLDKVYRRPFVVPQEVSKLYERKTTFRDIIGSFLGFNVPLTMQELKVPPRTGVPRKGFPVAIPPFSLETLLENDHIKNAAQAQARLVQSKGHNTTIEQELSLELQHLVDIGDILVDPRGTAIDFCASCAETADVVDCFARDALAYAPQNRPNERAPYILLTADLLVPVVYNIVCTEYLNKNASEEAKASNKFWFGVKTSLVMEAIDKRIFPNIKLAHIQRALKVLVELDWIYDVQDHEYRPLQIPPTLAAEYDDS